MSLLPILQELQSVHDNLKTIERDLAAFPPDLAAVDKELKALASRIESMEKAQREAQAKMLPLQKELSESQVLEAHARRAVKSADSKVQYTAAIRELDTRERLTAGIQKPLAALVKQTEELDQQLTQAKASREELQAQFEVGHQMFLEAHENQVAGRTRLLARQQELESALPSQDLQRFNRLLGARQGKALAQVADSTCQGCRTRIRISVMNELREKGLVACESCQRFLHLAPRP